jgi:hypothetical protein
LLPALAHAACALYLERPKGSRGQAIGPRRTESAFGRANTSGAPNSPLRLYLGSSAGDAFRLDEPDAVLGVDTGQGRLEKLFDYIRYSYEGRPRLGAVFGRAHQIEQMERALGATARMLLPIDVDKLTARKEKRVHFWPDVATYARRQSPWIVA